MPAPRLPGHPRGHSQPEAGLPRSEFRARRWGRGEAAFSGPFEVQFFFLFCGGGEGVGAGALKMKWLHFEGFSKFGSFPYTILRVFEDVALVPLLRAVSGKSIEYHSFQGNHRFINTSRYGIPVPFYE